METSNMKNMVVLKNLPSNLVEEAIVILKSSKKVKKLEKIDKNNKLKETETVKTIFNMVVNGNGINQIRNYLNKNKIPTKQNKTNQTTTTTTKTKQNKNKTQNNNNNKNMLCMVR